MLKSIQFQKMLLIAIVDAILAGFNLKLFPFDYTINLAVVVLPIYYFFNRSLNPIKTGAGIALFGLLFRTITGFYFYGSLLEAFWADFNFLFFDLTYGLIFCFMFYRKKNQTLMLLFFSALACDFLGNAAEFISRFGIESYFEGTVMATLLVVASTRAFVASLLILVIQYYNSFLRKQEHDERYRRQMQLISNLKGEIYFLKNNMEDVEAVMDEAFDLYKSFDLMTADEKKTIALSIAKNVHEIKKNYFRAVVGIDELILAEISSDHLAISDLFKMLRQSLVKLVDNEHKLIQLEFQTVDDTEIKEHNLLMSVLRNVLINAIESIDSSGKVVMNHHCTGNHHRFEIVDTGKGISVDILEYIFNPGFSTKFDNLTGNCNRGIGLTLVKDLVETHFGGQIQIESQSGIGTHFTIEIPRNALNRGGK